MGGEISSESEHTNYMSKNAHCTSRLRDIKSKKSLRDELAIYRLVKYAIKRLNLEDLIDEAAGDQTGDKYNFLVSEITNLLAGLSFKGKPLRCLITVPGGTVLYDSSKGVNNTYLNFSNRAINENHNTRIAILDAQNNRDGVGYEDKYSTSTRQNEIYVAVRVGKFLKSIGTCRFSMLQDITN